MRFASPHLLALATLVVILAPEWQAGRPKATSAFEQVPSRPGSIFGIVRRPDGSVVESFSITASKTLYTAPRTAAEAERAFITREVRNPQGRFELADLEPGTWTLRLRSSDDELCVLRVELSREGLGLACVVEPPASLSGVVVDAEGEPVADTLVLWEGTDSGSGRATGHTTTDALGRFALSVLPGVGTLEARPPESGPSSWKALLAESGRVLSDLRLALPKAGSPSLELHGERGDPLAGVSVVAFSVGARGYSNGITDSRGRLSLEGLPPGPAELTLQNWSRDVEECRRLMAVDPEERLETRWTQLVTLTPSCAEVGFKHPPLVPFQCQGGAEGILEPRTVHLFHPGEGWSVSLPARTVRDVVRLAAPPGRVEVRLGPSCWAVDVRREPTVTLQRLGAGSIEGVVRDEFGRPAPEARVQLGGQERWKRTTDGGRYSLGGVPVGETVLRASSGTRVARAAVGSVVMARLGTAALTIEEDRRCEVDVTLAPSGTTELRIVLEGGSPMGGAGVAVWDNRGALLFHGGCADEEGLLRIEGSTAGMRVCATAGRFVSRIVRLERGDQELLLSLERGRLLERLERVECWMDQVWSSIEELPMGSFALALGIGRHVYCLPPGDYEVRSSWGGEHATELVDFE